MSPAAPRCRARPRDPHAPVQHPRAPSAHPHRARSGVAKEMTTGERTPPTRKAIRTSGSWESGRPHVGGAPLASIRFATPTLRNTWQAPHRNRPPRPDGRGGRGGGAPLSSYLSASPKCGQECRTPPQSFPRDVPASRHVPGETLQLCVWGGCATVIHLFWRHRRVATGCCIPPKEKGRAIVWVGCATVIHLFWRHRKVGTGCCISPSKAARGAQQRDGYLQSSPGGPRRSAKFPRRFPPSGVSKKMNQGLRTPPTQPNRKFRAWKILARAWWWGPPCPLGGSRPRRFG